jgi:hypothetical protein
MIRSRKHLPLEDYTLYDREHTIGPSTSRGATVTGLEGSGLPSQASVRIADERVLSQHYDQLQTSDIICRMQHKSHIAATKIMISLLRFLSHLVCGQPRPIFISTTSLNKYYPVSLHDVHVTCMLSVNFNEQGRRLDYARCPGSKILVH